MPTDHHDAPTRELDPAESFHVIDVPQVGEIALRPDEANLYCAATAAPASGAVMVDAPALRRLIERLGYLRHQHLIPKGPHHV